jgi:mono/diheme cytochrome c family protein
MRRRFFESGVLIGMILVVAGFVLAGCSGGPSGAELYTLNCGGCHGAAGKGGLATALSPPAYLATHDDNVITRMISEGVPDTRMRAFGKANGGTLTGEQITLIVKYLHSIRSDD